MTRSLDFSEVARTVDLRGIIESELGPPDRSRRWICPFHDDHNPSLGISRDGRRFRCWSCGVAGTAIDWRMLRDGLSVVDAVRQLTGDRPIPPRSKAPARQPKPIKPKVLAWVDDEWQSTVRAIVDQAAETLWSHAGRSALDWLRGRGLDDLTIRRFHLGFVPVETWSKPLACLGAKSIWIARGITIPWAAPESHYSLTRDPDYPDDPGPRLCGVNVRRLMDDVNEPLPHADKCIAFSGSTRGIGYPFPEFISSQWGRPVLIVEGEIDALLAEQELGDLARVVTFGGANQPPSAHTLDSIRPCSHWLIATDHDRAGNDAAKSFAAMNPLGSRRLYLPVGKDIGDFIRSGADLRQWFTSELRRLGLGGRRS